MRRKVIQWTTGNVGRIALREILAHPELELVGCYAHSPSKVGRDAGELCGAGATGVRATDDVAALLRLGADCVSYNALWPDVDQLVRILETGTNVVTTSAFVTGWGVGTDARARLEAAARRGGATLFGTGMNPGFANLLALVSAGICSRIDKITVTESADPSVQPSAETLRSVGFGDPPDRTDLHERLERGTRVFGDAVYFMADALALDVTALRCESEFAVATKDQDFGFMKIAAGQVSAVQASWHGFSGDRDVIELRVRWKMGRDLDPDWPIEHGYRVRIDGYPRVRTRLDILPPPDARLDRPEELVQLGMTITAMPAVNAIPSVCAAPPGIRTYRDLPLITGAHLARASGGGQR